eukprot:9496539-Pyramimonas_sp.AAC.1
MAQPAVLEGLDNEHLLRMLAGTHTSTWFETKGSQGVVRTTSGSRSGSSPADLVFNLLFVPIVKEVRNELDLH